MKENKSRDRKAKRNSKACPWLSDPALLGGTSPNHAPKATGFRLQGCQPSWRHPQCVGRRPRLAGARRWPSPTACGAQVWPWRGRRGGAFLPAFAALPGAACRMLFLPWPAVTRGVQSGRAGRRRVMSLRTQPAWLFFPLGWWQWHLVLQGQLDGTGRCFAHQALLLWRHLDIST